MFIDYEHKKRIENSYFKEYIGSLVLHMAAKHLSDEDIKNIFDHIDSLNGPSHPYYREHKEVRGELRELFEKNIRKERDNISILKNSAE